MGRRRCKSALWEQYEIFDMVGSKTIQVTGVAQLVSALDTIIPEVAGSNPATGPLQCVFFMTWTPPAATARDEI